MVYLTAHGPLEACFGIGSFLFIGDTAAQAGEIYQSGGFTFHKKILAKAKDLKEQLVGGSQPVYFRNAQAQDDEGEDEDAMDPERNTLKFFVNHYKDSYGVLRTFRMKMLGFCMGGVYYTGMMAIAPHSLPAKILLGQLLLNPALNLGTVGVNELVRTGSWEAALERLRNDAPELQKVSWALSTPIVIFESAFCGPVAQHLTMDWIGLAWGAYLSHMTHLPLKEGSEEGAPALGGSLWPSALSTPPPSPPTTSIEEELYDHPALEVPQGMYPKGILELDRVPGGVPLPLSLRHNPNDRAVLIVLCREGRVAAAPPTQQQQDRDEVGASIVGSETNRLIIRGTCSQIKKASMGLRYEIRKPKMGEADVVSILLSPEPGPNGSWKKPYTSMRLAVRTRGLPLPFEYLFPDPAFEIPGHYDPSQEGAPPKASLSGGLMGSCLCRGRRG